MYYMLDLLHDYYLPDHFYFSIKGSDASWEHDQEPPPEVRKNKLKTLCDQCILHTSCLWWNLYYLLVNLVKFLMNFFYHPRLHDHMIVNMI